MKTNENEKKLKKAIIKSTNAIRKKYRDLHQQRLNSDEEFRLQYKPLIDPLNKLTKNKEELLGSESKLKPIAETTFDEINPFPDEETPKQIKKNKIGRKLNFDESAEDFSTNFGDDPFERIDEANSGNHAPASGSRSRRTNNVASLESLSDCLNVVNANKHDPKFGVRQLRNNYVIGRDVVNFNNGKIGVKNKEFDLTKGLKNLLFLKTPNVSDCTSKDFDAYKNILILTNAHKKFYDQNEKLLTKCKVKKYKEIILPLFKVGASMQTDFMLVNKNKKKIEYTYWDNPNELIDRLRLLLSSKSAGHSGHNNEIISIIEELREVDIIF